MFNNLPESTVGVKEKIDCYLNLTTQKL